MATDRRSFLTTVAASAFCPVSGWAGIGGPAFLSAARLADGQFVLEGLGADGAMIFRLPLPARGHAAAAHPTRADAVVFARRPGTYALVLDCTNGQVRARLKSPPGRHFYGHGAFSQHGDLLFTTENDFEAARGVIGIWDAGSYRRLAEIPSGGVGPHDIKRIPGTDQLVVANGGIETHPDSGRAKLNLPVMRSNLTILDGSGIIGQYEPADNELRLNSLRHLAVSATGRIAVGAQWQGAPQNAPPLLAVLDPDGGLIFHAVPAGMQGYVGSIAFSGTDDRIAITAPRGDLAASFDADGHLMGTLTLTDVCGVAASGSGFMLSTGEGDLVRLEGEHPQHLRRVAQNWDNHLIALA